MKLGIHTGYWSSGPPAGIEDVIAEADRLGLDSIWTAEAYGSDCLTPLAWWGSKTKNVRLGTNILQLSARTPTATAMAALTLDYLSGGRFALGIGASGPQVVEGWYGQAYPKPLARTREYIEIVRKVVARERVEHSGEFFQLPYQGGTGLGKPLKSTVHPLRTDIPIYLAAEGPKNVALAAEIADGWLPMFFSPRGNDFFRTALQNGFDKPNARRDWDTFDVPATVPVIVNDDVEQAADWVRPMLALYIGGMGAKGANFHFDVFVRLGYEAECHKIQDLYLDGHKAEAIAAVPTRMVEDIALIGPLAKITDELGAWRESVITTLLVNTDVPTLRVLAEIVA
nr:LLM class F420-dependent oxidoreductase [Kibdelosporangium sp. MJ126-NF4]CEL16621.1 Coenzyme F420-dependent oxidoreductase [Kibdelosporangium sp. MJ126-NF4]CTQ89028.1 Coenzyme F420-dependent oxidoreductase [Kibdelosporangium sp. MJ126-NF4]